MIGPRSTRFLLEWLEVPAGFEAFAEDVNDDGTVVGHILLNQPWSDEVLPCYWLAGGRMVSLERREGRHHGSADGINQRGTIVGRLNDGAVQWASCDGAGSRLEELPIEGSTSANAVNDRGEIVGGWSARSADYVLDRAFVWTRERMVWLEGCGGNVTLAFDINHRGVVVGWSTDKRDRHRAVMWQDGHLQVLPSPRFTRRSGAYGVNAADVITGYVENRSSRRHTCLWQAGMIRELPGCSACENQPWGINDAGWVTGFLTLPSGIRHAFLHTSEKLIDLHELVKPAAGEVLSNGKAVNNQGWIAGTGGRGDTAQAFLLRPL